MKKFLFLLFLVPSSLFLASGCGENSQASVEVKEVVPVKNSITVQVNGKNFSATLADNPTAKNFSALLPLEVDMTELNGNEKYFYLEKNLPSDSVSVKQIHAGDLMLFGSNCVVIFYKDFATNYSYTRLGKIDSPNDLEKILGAGNVRVKFFGGE